MAAPVGNKYAVGNNGGRPPMYANAEEIIIEIDAYFEYIKGESHEETDEDSGEKIKTWDRMPEPATVTGLALYLGFSDKNALYDYQAKEEFTHCIKKARARIEHGYEKCLHGDKPTGAIFALKNMGWHDKQQIDHGGQPDNPIKVESEIKSSSTLEKMIIKYGIDSDQVKKYQEKYGKPATD